MRFGLHTAGLRKHFNDVCIHESRGEQSSQEAAASVRFQEGVRLAGVCTRAELVNGGRAGGVARGVRARRSARRAAVGGRRGSAAGERQRCAASGSQLPLSRPPSRAAVGGACGDWRAGGEVGSTLFFMLMREWGLSVFTLRREPPPFIHPHGPSRCCRRRPTCAFAPLRALGRGRGGGDDPRRVVAARAPREAPWRGRPVGRPHPRPGASGRSKAEAGGEAGARARGGRGEDGGGYSSCHTRGPNCTKSFSKDTCKKKVFPSGKSCDHGKSDTATFEAAHKKHTTSTSST
ncbi:uncharacterized protein LOC109264172 [Panthera pardus]|uniref:Uncharacterized protein LOC109264172 n=1 Tax=Panthera pardus TaxID=9691 RepID=A0A9W2VGF1_PANPR|nr:uncharacterized protein LOC109264172 [Panthera pardus]